MSPEQQIQRRNAASREDAVAQAPARIAAAARALQSLSLELATERNAEQARADRLTPAAERAAKQSPTAATAPTAPSASEAEAPAPATSERERERPSTEAPPPGAGAGAHTPLLEVKPSPLGTDLEHIGDRLAIFPDRVELRDRLDRVRQVIAGDAIADVVVHKKLTGAVLSIESAKGPAIVAKGLRPDQAEEVRLLILRKTRSVGPVTRPTPTSASRRGGTEQPDAEHPEQRPGAAAPLDESELLRMLTDLHRAGVITSAELEDKVALVGRLVQGSRLTVTPT